MGQIKKKFTIQRLKLEAIERGQRDEVKQTALLPPPLHTRHTQVETTERAEGVPLHDWIGAHTAQTEAYLETEAEEQAARDTELSKAYTHMQDLLAAWLQEIFVERWDELVREEGYAREGVCEAAQVALGEVVADERHAQTMLLIATEADAAKRAQRLKEELLSFNIGCFAAHTALEEGEQRARQAVAQQAQEAEARRRQRGRRKESRHTATIELAAQFNRKLDTLLRAEEEERSGIRCGSYSGYFDLRELFSEACPRVPKGRRGSGGGVKRHRYILHSQSGTPIHTQRMSSAERLRLAEEMFRHTIHSAEKLDFNKLLWNAEQSHTRMIIGLVKAGRDYEYFASLLPAYGATNILPKRGEENCI